MTDPLIGLLVGTIITAVIFQIRKWQGQRQHTADDRAIKVPATVLDVLATGLTFRGLTGSKRQFDIKVELHQAQGLHEVVTVTQWFREREQPNIGEEITVYIDPIDKYDRWIPEGPFKPNVQTTIFGLKVNYRRTKWRSNG